ncbi:type II secretion system F family protein [Bacillaceae bacterium CLA-AA-H227]|uniref:Type II secretion system protein GspF domain-containing protein n=2 Tax=Robertmurraya TaxID=2837507 RepID=A0A4U1CZD1_9BACI|nr:type II secretion system F family protein [Robertmurraya kyonggiensis]TKC15191.1 hypothetical protein FA727_20125 [Robertmurraya kyonggiensis]
MSQVIPIIGLIAIGVLAYLAIMQLSQVSFSRRRKRLSSILRVEDEGTSNFLLEWLEKSRIREYVSPSYIIEEAKLHGVNMTKQSFISTFVVGTGLGAIIILVYFQPLLFLMPLAAGGGVIATNIRLHKIKKEYVQELDSKLAIYMSALTTSIGTFNNIKDALQSILPSLEYPIRNDVEEAILKLQDGKNVKQAFENMNKRYKHKHVRLFHDQLAVVMENGASDNSTLRSVAIKMKDKEKYRRRLQTAHRQNYKIWRTFVILILSAPFLFIFVSMDNYKLVMNHIASSIVFAITFLLIFVTYRQLEKLEIYDPTSDERVEV